MRSNGSCTLVSKNVFPKSRGQVINARVCGSCLKLCLKRKGFKEKTLLETDKGDIQHEGNRDYS